MNRTSDIHFLWNSICWLFSTVSRCYSSLNYDVGIYSTSWSFGFSSPSLFWFALNLSKAYRHISSWSTSNILARCFHYYCFSAFAITFVVATVFTVLFVSTSASSFDIVYTSHTSPIAKSSYATSSYPVCLAFLAFLTSLVCLRTSLPL